MLIELLRPLVQENKPSALTNQLFMDFEKQVCCFWRIIQLDTVILMYYFFAAPPPSMDIMA